MHNLFNNYAASRGHLFINAYAACSICSQKVQHTSFTPNCWAAAFRCSSIIGSGISDSMACSFFGKAYRMPLPRLVPRIMQHSREDTSHTADSRRQSQLVDANGSMPSTGWIQENAPVSSRVQIIISPLVSHYDSHA